jgi:putative ABC transport system permease protein
VGNPTLSIVARTSIDTATAVSELRAAVQAIDPNQPIADVRTMDEWLGRALQPRRAPTTLLGAFAVAALALAGIGIYGVLAYAVTERAREFGIRQALGADPRSILSLVLAQGLRPAGAGIALGLASSFALTRHLQSMLFGVDRGDPIVLAGVSAVLFAVAALACYLPARWATRVDPMVALRES